MSAPLRSTLSGSDSPTKRTPRSASSSATSGEASGPNTHRGAGSGLTSVTSPETPSSPRRVAVSNASSYRGSGHEQPRGTAKMIRRSVPERSSSSGDGCGGPRAGRGTSAHQVSRWPHGHQPRARARRSAAEQRRPVALDAPREQPPPRDPGERTRRHPWRSPAGHRRAGNLVERLDRRGRLVIKRCGGRDERDAHALTRQRAQREHGLHPAKPAACYQDMGAIGRWGHKRHPRTLHRRAHAHP